MMPAPSCPALPLLFDPLCPEEGAWVAVPLPLLRRLPASAGGGKLAFLGLPEALAAEAAPATRMTLKLAYVPAALLPARAWRGLPLRAVARASPGCAARLRGLPWLEASVVRFGFAGAGLVLADGRNATVTGSRSLGGWEVLEVSAAGEALEVPLRRFTRLVRAWGGAKGDYHPMREII